MDPTERYSDYIMLKNDIAKAGSSVNRFFAVLVSIALIAGLVASGILIYQFGRRQEAFEQVIGLKNTREPTRTVPLSPTPETKKDAHASDETGGMRVAIRVEPPGAELVIFQDDQIVSKMEHVGESGAELTLRPGRYSMETRKPGFKTLRQYLYVSDNKESFSFRLVPETSFSEMLPADMTTPQFGYAWRVPEVGIEMMPIPAGKLRLRIDEKKEYVISFERPFWVSRFEINQVQYEEIMWKNPSFFRVTGPKAPVDNVSWNDAFEFLARINKAEEGRTPENYTYRLPTYEEWEYLCRAGSESTFPFGNDPERLDEYAWHISNSSKRTQATGEKLPNSWGIFDALGNVWEWCLPPVSFPATSVMPPLAEGESGYILRGGCWRSIADQLEISRSHFVVDSPDFKSSCVGFRILLAPEAQAISGVQESR
jgi:formylglycine-generating enzyme required for sulfatase activity